MRYLALSAFALSLVSGTFVAAAQADTPAFKIGYVDMQSALNLIEEGKKEKNKLKKDFDVKQKRLDDMQQELKKSKEDYDKQSAMLKDDVRMKKQTELQEKFMKLQQEYVAMQKDLSEREQAVTREIFGKMKGIIEKIGDRDNYTLILERNEGNVLYFKKHMDITDEVVRIYNSQFKVN
ncbi:MAG: OmpH family outer membrane protein [Deltaproteobacteria bacterium]|nr:OmpH family outer membrane protein [Deltaproteobacteria bacterium]